MKLEDYLITRDKLKLIANPAHRVWLEDNVIYITRNKAPQFKGIVSILNSEFSIQIIEWLNEQPPIEKQNLLNKKALSFLINFFIIKKLIIEKL